jgi:hypothetical protein
MLLLTAYCARRAAVLSAQQVSSAAGAVKSSLSRSSSEQLRCSDQADGYDAAAVAVDMVSLERGTSGRSRSSAAAAAAGGSNGGMAAAFPGASLPRAGSRGLASRSVGLVGAYAGSYNHGSKVGNNGADSGSGMVPQELKQWAASKYRPSQSVSPNPDLKGLATRSTNPHLPPVAPVAPSLATISTGLAAYSRSSAAAAAAGGGGGDGSVAGSSGKHHQPQGLPWATSGKAERSLASQSVPAAGIVAAAAAAAAVAASVKPAPPKSTAGSTDARSMGGGSTGNLLGMLRSSVGIGRSSGRSGKVTGRALTDDDGEYSDFSRPSDMSKLKGESVIGMCDADLADARSWLVTGGPACCCAPPFFVGHHQGCWALCCVARTATCLAAVSVLSRSYCNTVLRTAPQASSATSMPSAGRACCLPLAWGTSNMLMFTCLPVVVYCTPPPGPRPPRAGLKRYFHAKRMEGLLSASGLRILDSGCEVLLEAPHKPLHLWSIVSA